MSRTAKGVVFYSYDDGWQLQRVQLTPRRPSQLNEVRAGRKLCDPKPKVSSARSKCASARQMPCEPWAKGSIPAVERLADLAAPRQNDGADLKLFRCLGMGHRIRSGQGLRLCSAGQALVPEQTDRQTPQPCISSPLQSTPFSAPRPCFCSWRVAVKLLVSTIW